MTNLYRNRKPLPAEEYKFKVPEIQRSYLENGLEIILVERHNLPLVRVNLMAGCGSSFDPHDKKGLSNIFSMSIDEGAGQYNALELSNEFDILGSDFDVRCTNDSVFFLSRSLKENLERTVQLFSLIICTPHLAEEDILKQKRKVLTRMQQIKDDPDEISANAFISLVFNRKHPYAFPIIGNENDIKSLSTEDISTFYNDFLRPAQSHLIFTGDLTMKEAVNIAGKYFSRWRKKHTRAVHIAPPDENGSGIYFIDKAGAVQSEIKMGHLTQKRNLNNYFPRLLLNMVLGGQFSSRLNLNLREKKGYTYGAFSGFHFLKHGAYFSAATSVGSNNTYNAYSELMKELTMIRNGITREELIFAKTSLMRKFPMNFETNGLIASSLSRMILFGFPDDYFKNYLPQLHDISTDQVNSAAEQYIVPEKIITLIVGNRKDILKQFKDKERIIELELNGNLLS